MKTEEEELFHVIFSHSFITSLLRVRYHSKIRSDLESEEIGPLSS